MSILSLSFAGLVLVSLVVYYLLPPRPQNYWLLLVSYVFVVSWSWQFAIVLAITTVVNFGLARGLRVDGTSRRGRLWLGISLNVASLVFFKYANFFLPELLTLFAGLGVPTLANGLQILLPLGLSYYVLQSIAYLLDVSRGQMPPATDLVDFGLYMAYFPKLVAGPIERARTFLPKLAQPRVVDNDALARGATLIVMGLFRKVVIADPLASLIDPFAFSLPGSYSTPLLWFYLLAYAFSLYNDFAGYTSIVRGVSTLFGIELSPNFYLPYFSRSYNEFWNRWHISLSHWLRDYIYLPLSRVLLKRFPDRRHLVHLLMPPMVTMVVSALWHATWDHEIVLVWGVLHGLYQIVERLPAWLGRPVTPLDVLPRWQQFIRGGLIFLTVCLAWIFFWEGGGLGSALAYLAGLFNFASIAQWARPDWHILPPIALAVLVDWVQARGQDETVFRRWSLLARSTLLAGVIVLIFFATQGAASKPFVYQGF